MTQPIPLPTTALDAVRHLIIPANCRRSYASSAPVSDDGLASFNNNRHFPTAAGVLQHLFQFLDVFLDIKIDCFVAVG